MKVFKMNDFILKNMLSICAILVLGLNAVTSQNEQSPCPGIFEYRRDYTGIIGVIHLRSNGPVSSVRVVANFTVASRLPNDYQGRLEPIGNSADLLLDVNRGAPLDYRVEFPITWPLPRLSGITVNGNGLCYGPGDIVGPDQYLTPISLQHTLILRGQGSGSFNQYQQSQSQQRPSTEYTNYNGQVPNNAPTYGNYDSQQNSGNPIFMNPVNNTRPVYQQAAPASSPTPEVTPPPTVLTPQRPTVSFIWPTASPSPRPLSTAQAKSNFTSESEDSMECGIVSDENERRPIIHNGQSYDRGDWPWLVAIYIKHDTSLRFICAGTLVSDRHVITAAHCKKRRGHDTDLEDLVVRMGVHNLENWIDDTSVSRTVANADIHESFDETTLSNDLLILTLNKGVEFTPYIRPACLWKQERNDLSRIVGATGVVAGWGILGETPAGRGDPRVVRIEVVSTETCRASKPLFHKLTSENTLCAGGRNGEGPCVGDSGAGLHLLEGGRWRLRGIVSVSLRPDNGESTCNLKEFTVFTDTAKFLNWINRVLATKTIATRPANPLRIPLSVEQSESNVDSATCGIASDDNERRPIIHNGQSYDRGDWPWLVAIYKNQDKNLRFICAGTLVSDRHVVTAAHCMQLRHSTSSTKDFVLKIGVHNLEDWADDISVARTVAKAAIHESYNATSLSNDLMILTLDKGVEFTPYIRPVCLWKQEKADLGGIVGTTGVVAGWGILGDTPAERGDPRVVRIEVVSTETCRASQPLFHKLTSENTLCAGGRNGEGPCAGDSGAGLYLLEGGRWRLRGIVSLALQSRKGGNNCNLNEYVVFTDTAKYLDWINNELTEL